MGTTQFKANGLPNWLQKSQLTTTFVSQVAVAPSLTELINLVGCDIISSVNSAGEFEIQVLKQHQADSFFIAKNITSIDVADVKSFYINSQDQDPVLLVFVSPTEMQSGFLRAENICNKMTVPPCS